MKSHSDAVAGWYATRSIPMPDADEKGVESILIWIEHRTDGSWAVGRANDLTQRDFPEPRNHDYVFEGFDMQDALDAANNALEDDVTASELDGIDAGVRPFYRAELEQPLNEWFWGRRAA